MADDLKLTLKLQLGDALSKIDQLDQKIIELQNRTSKPIASTAFKSYSDLAKNASTTTTQLGRRLDAVVAQYGQGSAEMQRFVQQQLKSNQVAQLQRQAFKHLKTALQNGEISTERYNLELKKLSNTQQLFINKMKQATPMRQMQRDLSGVTNMLSMINPQLGAMISSFDILRRGLGDVFGSANMSVMPSVQAPVDLKSRRAAMAAQVGATQVGAGGQIAAKGLNRATVATRGWTAALMGLNPIIFGAVAAIGALTAGFKGLTAGISTGKKFEDMEYQMSALINASTKFKDKVTGEFVDMDTNLELSLASSRKLIQRFVDDAPKLAGTTLEELAQTASVTLGRIAGAGITDPEKQATLIENMTIAIKTITKGQQNVGVQLAQESRSLLAGQFRASNLLINTLATNVGGKKVFKKMFDEAKQAGRLGEFLSEQMEPFVRSANFASQTLGNFQEIWSDFWTNFNKTIGESRVLEATKILFKDVLSVFVDVENEKTFGKIKESVLAFAEAWGETLANAMLAVRPLIKPIVELLAVLFQAVKVAIDIMNPFITVLASVAKVSWNLTKAIVSLTASFVKNNSILQILLAGTGKLFRFISVGAQFIAGFASDWRAGWEIVKESVFLVFEKIELGILKLFNSIKFNWGKVVGFFNKDLGASLQSSSVDTINRIGELQNSTQARWARIKEGFAAMQGRGKPSSTKLTDFDAIFRGDQPGATDEKQSEAAQKKAASDQTRIEAERQIKELQAVQLDNKRYMLELEAQQLQKTHERSMAELALQEELAGLDHEERVLDIQRDSKDITEAQYDEEKKRIALQKIELNLQGQLAKINAEQDDIESKRLKIANEIAKIRNEQAQNRTKIGSIEEQQRLLQAQQAAAQTAKERLAIQAKIDQLEAKKADLLAKIQAGNITIESDLYKQLDALGLQTNELQKQAELAKLKAGYAGEEINLDASASSAGGDKQGDNLLQSLIAGGKNIAQSIMSAFEDGKVTIQEAFGIAEQIFNKLADIFKSFGDKLGGLGGMFSGGMSGGFAGFMKGLDPMALFGSVLSLGGVAADFIGGMGEKKRQKQMEETERFVKKNLEKLNATLDAITSRVEREIYSISRVVEQLEYDISNIDTSSSIYRIQNAIEKTIEAIQLTQESYRVLERGINEQIGALWGTAYTFVAQAQYVNYGSGGSMLYDEAGKLVDQIYELQDQLRDEQKSLNENILEYQRQIEQFIEAQKQLIAVFEEEYQLERAEATFGDIGRELASQVFSLEDKIRELLMSGFDPEKVSFMVERQILETRQSMQEAFARAVDDFANQILSLNEELLGVISEGRITGKIQKTRQDKIEDIRARLEQLRADQEAQLGSGLGGLTNQVTDATNALEHFTQMLNDTARGVVGDVQAGRDELAGIQLVINDPAKIAELVEQKLNSQYWLTSQVAV